MSSAAREHQTWRRMYLSYYYNYDYDYYDYYDYYYYYYPPPKLDHRPSSSQSTHPSFGSVRSFLLRPMPRAFAVDKYSLNALAFLSLISSLLNLTFLLEHLSPVADIMQPSFPLMLRSSCLPSCTPRSLSSGTRRSTLLRRCQQQDPVLDRASLPDHTQYGYLQDID